MSAGQIQVLDELPGAIARVGRLAMDNPGQIALVTATSLVTAKILARAMRPDNMIEALALLLVSTTALGAGFGYLTAKGYMSWRIRDESGQLVPLIPKP